MFKFSLFTTQYIGLFPVSLLLRLKDYFSYSYYLKKQSATKDNLEIRLRNSLDGLSEIRIREVSSDEKWEEVKDCELSLHKISQADANISNKNIIQKLKVSKASYKSFSRLEKNFGVVESSLQELRKKQTVEYKEIKALDEYINCLYIDLTEEQSPLLTDFEKNYRGTITSKIYRKKRLRTSSKNEKLSYLNSVLNKLINEPPQYTLDGAITNKKYRIKNNTPEIKYKRGPIRLECSYFGSILNSNAIKTGIKSNIICYVADEISTPSKKFIENFTRTDKLLFSYSMCEEKLYQSPHMNSDIYSRYFDPEKVPLSIEDILFNSLKRGVKNV